MLIVCSFIFLDARYDSFSSTRIRLDLVLQVGSGCADPARTRRASGLNNSGRASTNCIRVGLNRAHVLKCRPSTTLKHGGLVSGRAGPDLARNTVPIRGRRGRAHGRQVGRVVTVAVRGGRGRDHGGAVAALFVAVKSVRLEESCHARGPDCISRYHGGAASVRGTSRACLLWHPAIPPQFGCLLVEEEQGPAADVGRRTAATTGTEEEDRRHHRNQGGGKKRRRAGRLAHADWRTNREAKEPPPENRTAGAGNKYRATRDRGSPTLNRVGLARARPTMACRAIWAVGPPAEGRPSPSNVPC
jgi:hypothetical protein